MMQRLVDRLERLAEQFPGIRASIAGVWNPGDIVPTFSSLNLHPAVFAAWLWTEQRPAIIVLLWTRTRVPTSDVLAVRHVEAIGRELGVPGMWERLAKSRPWSGGVAATDKLPMKRAAVEPVCVPAEDGESVAIAGGPAMRPLLLAAGWTEEQVTVGGRLTDGWLVESNDVFHDLADLLRTDLGGVEAATAPPKLRVVEVLLDPPQITLEEGETFALTPNQAAYLKALLEANDWLSDVEFRRRHPAVGENARPDLWRKDLPERVRERIQTDRRKGSRWRSGAA